MFSMRSSLTLLLLLGSMLSHTTWAQDAVCTSATLTLLSPHPTSEDLNAVLARAPRGGAALVLAGDAGSLLVSANGSDFASVPEAAHLDERWLALHQPERDVLIARGQRALLRSDDGGASWRVLELPRGVGGPMFWLNSDTAFIAPEGTLAAATTNGGESWDLFALEEPALIDEAVVFLDASTGFGVGRNGLFTTVDGGRSWRSIRLIEGRQDWLHDIAFTAEGTLGYASAAGRIYHTTDRGKTWSAIPLAERSSLVALSLVGDAHVFALAESGGIWSSSDAGKSFAMSDVGVADLNDVLFRDSRNGYIIGDAGTLLATDDGGTTWISLQRGTGYTLESLTALSDPSNVMALGPRGVVMQSDDAGESWKERATSGLPPVYDMAAGAGGVLAIARGALIHLPTPDASPTTVSGVDTQALNVFARVAALDDAFYMTMDQKLYRWTVGAVAPEPVRVRLGGRTAQKIFSVDAHANGLMVSTERGVGLSADGKRFRTLGPAGLVPEKLAPSGSSTALAVLGGGVVVELDGAHAWLVSLLSDFDLYTTTITPRGSAWFGGEHGLLFEVVEGRIDVHAFGVDESILAIAFKDDLTGAALTATGKLFLTEYGGESWRQLEALEAWEGLDAAEAMGASAPVRGALVWLDNGALIVAGPGGQAQRIEASFGQGSVLSTGAKVDFAVAKRLEEGSVLLGGHGRTVLLSRDRGETWLSITDDLAPETVTALALDANLQGVIGTSAGTLLRFDPEQAWYHPISQEHPPLTGLIRDGEERLWLGTGRGEIVHSTDASLNDFELAPFPSFEQPISTLDLRGTTLAIAGAQGLLRQGNIESGSWELEAPIIDEVVALFGDAASDEVILLTRERKVWLWQGSNETLSCLGVSTSLSGVRDAVRTETGWLLVGAGGMVARLIR